MTYIPVRGGDRAEARERLLSQRYHDHGADGRTLLGVVLGLVVFLLVGFYSLRQQASESSAQTVLEDAIAATTDLDVAVAEALPEMREEARSGESTLIELPGFPVAVFLTPDEVLSLDEQQVHDLLLSRAAAVVYHEGWGAFDQTGGGSVSLFTAEGFSYRLLDRLDSSTERRARNASLFLAIVAVGVAVTVFAIGEGYGRFRALALPILFAAAPGIIIALFAKVLFKLFGNDDRFTEDLLSIVNAVSDIPLRNYIILAGLGAVVLAVGPALRLVDARLPGESSHGGEVGFQPVSRRGRRPEEGPPGGPRPPRGERTFEPRPPRERPEFEPGPRPDFEARRRELRNLERVPVREQVEDET